MTFFIGLVNAMANPHREGLDKHIEKLEAAINFIKRNGFEYLLTHELIEANKLLLQLKKRYVTVLVFFSTIFLINKL